MVTSEHFTSAAKSSLDLVNDEKYVVLVTKGTDSWQVSLCYKKKCANFISVAVYDLGEDAK